MISGWRFLLVILTILDRWRDEEDTAVPDLSIADTPHFICREIFRVELGVSHSIEIFPSVTVTCLVCTWRRGGARLGGCW